MLIQVDALTLALRLELGDGDAFWLATGAVGRSDHPFRQNLIHSPQYQPSL